MRKEGVYLAEVFNYVRGERMSSYNQVWNVEKVENDQFKTLLERKNSLIELSLILDHDYQKNIKECVNKDLLNVNMQIEEWRQIIIEKYKIPLDKVKYLSFNIHTGEIRIKD